MKVVIKKLNNTCIADYERFLKKSDNSMFYHSNSYRKILKKICSNVEDIYLLAYLDNEIIAALPMFIKKSRFGNVVNSLPFFGSNGGFISLKNTQKSAFNCLIQEYKKILEKKKIIFSTIIESPLSRNYEKEVLNSLNYTLKDERFSQITKLPICVNKNSSEIDEELFKIFHHKTRNMIRKAEKNNFKIVKVNDPQKLKLVYKLHCETLKRKGGVSKPWIFFKEVQTKFKINKDYMIYFALKNDKIASSLLTFNYKEYVEYFVPTINDKFKHEQPLSLIIFNAMKDSVSNAYKFWNWGGTWVNQKDLFRFKSRWGTINKKYQYHVYANLRKINISNLEKNFLLENYKFFYTIPFNILEN